MGKRFAYRHSHFISKGYARYFNSRLKHKTYDFIIAPAASCELAHLNTSIPIIYITDGTFGGCLNYHKALSNLMPFSQQQGHQIEQLAISKSAYVIASSEWCAQSVRQTYQQPKVNVVPFGANFDALPAHHEIVPKEVPTTWRLLFVGVYWESKGGDIAYACFRHLLQKGYSVSLTIVGCTPPQSIDRTNLTIIPFLDKNEAHDQLALKNLYATHQLLILPTRFDCTPIVINEAAAFGMPCLVADTGGVAGHLKVGENGYLLPYSDKGTGYARYVESWIQTPTVYLDLCRKTRQLYEQQLNWDSWTRAFEKIVSTVGSKL